jgi:glycerate 2-kinase
MERRYEEKQPAQARAREHAVINPRELLLGSFKAALSAVDPARVVPSHLPPPPRGRTLVVGAGKAAAAMALAVEQNWPPTAPLEGLVVTRYRHGLLTSRIAVVEAAHPVPDKAGGQSAREIMRRVKALTREDLLLVLLSGGGSSLFTLPVPGLSLAEIATTTRALLLCGAPIQSINTVRKHLSAVQGGRLAAASRAPLVALIISDVTGDDPTHIASGPCAPDPTTFADALSVLERYGVEAPPAVRAHLERGARGEVAETPKPGDRLFSRVENRVIATGHLALEAGAAHFEAHAVRAALLGDTVTGEAREVAKVYAALAREIVLHRLPWPAPVALLSGGECTVTVRGAGQGGRCTEFLLSLARELDGLAGVHALACDSDGIDGSEDNAGAVIGPETLERAAAQGLSAERCLDANDGYTFFSRLGDLVTTGPTRTNVNDFRAILIEATQ